jgi:hypothetical protein
MCTYTIPYNPRLAEGKGKEEAKFDFTSESEGYISLNSAIISALRLACQDDQQYPHCLDW